MAAYGGAANGFVGVTRRQQHTWHAHIYESRPKQPTPHLIDDILRRSPLSVPDAVTDGRTDGHGGGGGQTPERGDSAATAGHADMTPSTERAGNAAVYYSSGQCLHLDIGTLFYGI